ncbi:PTS system mannose-specific IIA component [Alkalibaculum bacchi]|uniref:PTS system mannose-specific IIA component n=1 Tax=Alkalibaculum bacchi TaxID=645887 RepID=A0A366IAI5_9FIRM|nr:PTS sugar transporter subunit IIA [Alkalibaculum bacchi]RBP67325.1 PTS system mannose-specific IIA component [Alkalibaculum bacchi]
MVGLLLISHGEMAAGMMDSLNLIAGSAESIDTVSLIAGQDFELFKNEISEKIKALDSGDGVLILVDLFGASPYNASMFLYKELKESGIHIRIVTGMSLSMLLEINAMRGSMSLEQLAQHAVNSGRDGIQEPISQMSNSTETDDEEGDY